MDILLTRKVAVGYFEIQRENFKLFWLPDFVLMTSLIFLDLGGRCLENRGYGSWSRLQISAAVAYVVRKESRMVLKGAPGASN